MNVDLGIWGKLTRCLIFLFALAGVLMIVVCYLPLIRKNERMRKAILQQEAKIQKEKEANRQLKIATETLQSDPKAVERLARERLGYARPDEVVVLFDQPATNRFTH